MNKKFIWFSIFVLVLIGTFFIFSEDNQTGYNFEIGIIHPSDSVKGNATSSVVLMEYSDFECPACRAYYPVVRELATEYGDRVAFVYRHFPLSQIHPNAEFASRASEAAKKQGKFWEMHDLLFQKQDEWSKEPDVMKFFENYAKLLSLDLEKFKNDFYSDEVKNLVRAQRVHSVKSGLQGTPTFFLNGQKIQNPSSIDEFKKLIDQALSASI